MGQMLERPDCTLYVIRHGRTALNASGVLRGRLDPALDEVGRAQAAWLARTLAPVELDKVVSSPLRRAMETAQAIASYRQIPVTYDPAWIDRDYGPFAGHPASELIDDYRSIDLAPGVEPLEHLRERVMCGLDALCKSIGAGWRVAAIAHDAVNKTLLSQLVDSLPNDPELIAQSTGCWNQLELHGGTWSAVVVNATPPGFDS